MKTKEVRGIGSIDSCSEGIVSRYARFICAMNLQCIAELLRQCWAFSVALDMATHMAISYCDVCIRICHKSTVHDFQLLSIPVHERHTGETIFNTFAKVMDALFPDWHDYWSFFGWREEDDWAASGRNHADTSRSQARVHARLVRDPPTRLVFAVVLLGHSRHVLLDIYIAHGVSLSAAELHLRRTEPVPSHFQHALAQHGQSDHLV
jgi:hypothetical protein